MTEKIEKAEVNPRADVRKKYSDAEAQAQAKYKEAVSEALTLVEEAREDADVKNTKAGRTLTRELDEAQQTMLKEMAKLDAKEGKTVKAPEPPAGSPATPHSADPSVPVTDSANETVGESGSPAVQLLDTAIEIIRDGGGELFVQPTIDGGYLLSFEKLEEGVVTPLALSVIEASTDKLSLKKIINGEAEASPLTVGLQTSADNLVTIIITALSKPE